MKVQRERRTRNGQLAAVIRLACLIEDRTDDEQRALIAWAWTCDREHNKDTTTNVARRASDWQLQDLVMVVHETRVLGEGHKHVGPPPRWNETWDRWRRPET